jgi:uncharacterized protein (TIGR02996 family)
MTNSEVMWEAVLKDCRDPLPKRVYADALDEEGEQDLAAAVRLGVERDQQPMYFARDRWLWFRRDESRPGLHWYILPALVFKRLRLYEQETTEAVVYTDHRQAYLDYYYAHKTEGPL